ncbi:hypothetical protein CHLRE_17g744747v5 [Chlamydomonas reinhardtii]|uniref:Uncharacterized protein n=2 Tax=Chlamydomonas reinhardtii TaxID=3055 RepID=A0A2K3CRZ8_CHLRE|nr:uncharacterized protein CHLRE_17g744747v5 [Chlamydomonas reinhardtii]PNW71057.1 hypothetical protein CHLRE_17g744747v5 [Chlamydomonas reinhardtii]
MTCSEQVCSNCGLRAMQKLHPATQRDAATCCSRVQRLRNSLEPRHQRTSASSPPTARRRDCRGRRRSRAPTAAMEEQPAVAGTAAAAVEEVDAGTRLAQRHEQRQGGRRHVLPPVLPRQPRAVQLGGGAYG